MKYRIIRQRRIHRVPLSLRLVYQIGQIQIAWNRASVGAKYRATFRAELKGIDRNSCSSILC